MGHMQLRLFTSLILVLLAAVLLASMGSINAQDISVIQGTKIVPTLKPSPTPKPVIPAAQSSVDVVGIPYSAVFDTDWEWLSKGAWLFDVADADSPASWFLDGLQRGQESILELKSLIDLSGTLSAQLMYRQKGNLPATDLIVVEISLNGGISWVVIDQQFGVETDWELHVIDLTEYRGQVVRLRFRISTAPQYGEDITISSGYRFDQMEIKYVPLPEPELVAVPDSAQGPPGTLLGLHLTVGANKDQVLGFARRLKEAGVPLGSLKGTTDTEDILNEVAQISPETVIIYRSLETPWGMIDCPDASKSPEAEAQTWMWGVSQFWDQVQADYYEIINECLPPADWMSRFSIEAMRIANEQGRCLLLFSYSGGTPEIDQFAQLRPAFEFAVQNPCQPGRYHGIALHAYSGEPNRWLSDSGIWLGLRHRLFYAEILPYIPEAIQLPLYLTEAGPGNGYEKFACEDITRDMMQYTSQLENDSYIRGFDLWNFGISAVDVTPCLPLLGDALIGYYGGS